MHWIITRKFHFSIYCLASLLFFGFLCLFLFVFSSFKFRIWKDKTTSFRFLTFGYLHMKTINFESACINQPAFERVFFVFFFQKFRGGNTGRGRGRSAVCVCVGVFEKIHWFWSNFAPRFFYALMFEQVVSVNCTACHRGWPWESFCALWAAEFRNFCSSMGQTCAKTWSSNLWQGNI